MNEKRGPGRPKADNPRELRLEIRMTQAEKNKIAKAATIKDLAVSTFDRQVSLKAANRILEEESNHQATEAI